VIAERNITCIVCPIGCKILVKTDGTQFEIVGGNKCKRGIEYARSEALDPRRMLTTSVLVNNGEWPLVSVKSSKPIPKEKLFSVLKEVGVTAVKAPVKSGQTIIKNAANTGIDIVATKTVLTKEAN
jgi:CxxC motif-containing protein